MLWKFIPLVNIFFGLKAQKLEVASHQILPEAGKSPEPNHHYKEGSSTKIFSTNLEVQEVAPKQLNMDQLLR